MLHTTGGLTDRNVNKEIHQRLTLSSTSLTGLSHSDPEVQTDGQTLADNNQAADNGEGAGTQRASLGARELREALTAGVGFIRAVRAVGPSVTVPVGGNAATAGATELTLGTCGCG